MEKFKASEVTQSETLKNNLSFQGRSETTKTVEDLTLFVATMSNMSSFADKFLSSKKRIDLEPRSNIVTKALNPVPSKRKQTPTDGIRSKQSEGFSLVGSLTSAVSLFATSFAVAALATVLGRSAALWNLPGTSSLLWHQHSLCSRRQFEDHQ